MYDDNCKQYRCDYCGRFVSMKDMEARAYTPYGGYLDLEPPDSVLMCGTCWNTHNNKALIRGISWQGPMKAFAYIAIAKTKYCMPGETPRQLLERISKTMKGELE